MTQRVAVVGSGIAGLAAARALAPHAELTLFEAGPRFGGHAQTIDVQLDGVTHGVDTGFLVYNERTYPGLVALFAELGVTTTAAEMSFSVQAPGLEWAGTDLNSVFAQRGNLLRPRFWRMLADLLRFNRLATRLAERGDEQRLQQPIGDFLAAHHFSKEFRDGYFLPMVACIWSCPTEQMLRFPVATMIRFCHNHGLLQISQRPQWYTVRGGSREYVRRIVGGLDRALASTPVRRVQRDAAGVSVCTDHGAMRFDAIVLACHSDQSLRLLDAPSADEQAVLGAIGYHRNRAVLHTDSRLLPTRPRAWAAWNYERGPAQREQSAVCLHYLINKLQPLPWSTPTVVTLNPVREPRPEQVLGEYDFAHPVFDAAAIAAQRRLAQIQGQGNVWYCGAWTGFGFHEDGLRSGHAVAAAIRERWAGLDRRRTAA